MATRELDPVPMKLRTPTDLRRDDVQAISAAINPLIADAFALYVKSKNFHWHLSGMHFRDLHLLFDDQADQILGSVDELAERVRKLGELTIRSVSQIGQLQTIHDDNHDYVPAREMVRRLLADNVQIASRQREAIQVCDEHRDPVTSNLLQEILDGTERRIWFLYEVSQDMENGG